jgi:methanethiol S-methyltransferase
MRSDYLLLGLLWIFYCAVHSLLITTGVVRFFKNVLGAHFAYYRLFYNVFSLLTLLPLVLYSRSLQYRDPMLFEWHGAWRILQSALLLMSALLFISGARHYSMSQFFGLQQVRRKQSRGALTASGDFDTAGILSVVRHPWYVAVFLLLWASDLNRSTIIVNLILSAYLVVGTLLEERKLVLEFGDRYHEYQKIVSMFLPIKWLGSKCRNSQPLPLSSLPSPQAGTTNSSQDD